MLASVLLYRPKHPCYDPLSPLNDIQAPHDLPFLRQFFYFPLLFFIGKAFFFSGLSSLRSLKEVMIDERFYYSPEWLEDVRGQLIENPNKPVLKRGMW